MAVDIDTVAAAYVKTRDEISALNKQIDALKEFQVKREAFMLAQLEKLNLQNVKTPHGVIIFKSLKESVTVSDWDSLLRWVDTQEKWEFLNKAANKTAVLDYMGDSRENPPPPGVSYVATRTVGVQKR